ncbi:helix-turn-helix domain-containing protein [Camelimonas abortus]|uniref:helix-turn-helix domain-containing protein n=1 Tax=Camelimonas abortus TaxID=1017184 RepID=UPI0035EF4396
MLLSLYRKIPVPPHGVLTMAELLRENGIDPAPAFAAAALSPEAARDPLATVSGAAELAFQETFVALTEGRRDLWLELGLRSRFLMLGTFGVAVMTARTLRAAMETAGRLAWLHNSLALYRLETGGDACTLRMRLDQAPARLHEFIALRDAPVITDLFNVIWGGRFPFDEIVLTAREAICARVRKPEKMEVRYGEPGAWWRWPAALLDRRLPAADRRSHEAALRQADLLLQRALAGDGARDPGAQVAALLREHGPGLTLQQAAARLGMSARTLQRRLTDGGGSFRRLQLQARMETARRLLRDTDLPVAEIAWRLGYAEPSAFNHRFRSAFGVSPRAWRRRAAPAAGETASRGE